MHAVSRRPTRSNNRPPEQKPLNVTAALAEMIDTAMAQRARLTLTVATHSTTSRMPPSQRLGRKLKSLLDCGQITVDDDTRKLIAQAMKKKEKLPEKVQFVVTLTRGCKSYDMAQRITAAMMHEQSDIAFT